MTTNTIATIDHFIRTDTGEKVSIYEEGIYPVWQGHALGFSLRVSQDEHVPLMAIIN